MNLKVYDIIKKSYKEKLNNDEIKICCESVDEDPSLLAWMYYATEEIQEAAILSTRTKDYKDGRIIQVIIKNVSERIKLIAVNKDGESIRYLSDPSEELQLVAINQNKLAIRFIKNPTKKVREAARIIVTEN